MRYKQSKIKFEETSFNCAERLSLMGPAREFNSQVLNKTFYSDI